MIDLRSRSLELLLQNQEENGAFPAALSFAPYRYCWLRDGSFIAYALLTSGETAACRRFLRWVDGVIQRHSHRIEEIDLWLRSLAPDAQPIQPPVFLHARYGLDGQEVRDGWPNFQIDGYGTWLWCLAEYLARTGDPSLLREVEGSVRLTLRYLACMWRFPTFDCWEENGDRVHPSTLACVYGGIRAINRSLRDSSLDAVADEIRRFVLAHATVDGRLAKYVGSASVDASLLWAAVPFALLRPDDPLMRRTVILIEERLLGEGGVKRYPEDTYYGGGSWILLSCWLGWYYSASGRRTEAESILRWVTAQADGEGNLPEQVATHLNDPAKVMEWEQRWGPAAKPLLWSHAMYLVLRNELAAGIPG